MGLGDQSTKMRRIVRQNKKKARIARQRAAAIAASASTRTPAPAKKAAKKA